MINEQVPDPQFVIEYCGGLKCTHYHVFVEGFEDKAVFVDRASADAIPLQARQLFWSTIMLMVQNKIIGGLLC